MGIQKYLFITFLISQISFAQDPKNMQDLIDVHNTVILMHQSEEEILDDIVKTHNKKMKKQKLDETECEEENKKILSVIPVEDRGNVIISVEKEKPKIRFYYKVIAPVEDIKNTSLDRVDKHALKDDFKKLIQAQDESSRNAAIAELCNGKSMMEKVQYGSALFNMLGDVYNHDMTNGRNDIYSANDPTKDPDLLKTITIQRQYNALNEKYYGGTEFDPVGGVCRHASVAVTDFLNQCGLDVKAQNNIGYRSGEGGHAVVRVVDPKTNKTYFLNWGELIESETIDPMANFDIPSKSIKQTGMIIDVYDGDDLGARDGSIRNSKGTFIARVLGTADDEIDVSTYTYNETGAIVDLGSKKIRYANGKVDEANTFITAKYAQGENNNGAGFENNIFSAGGSINYERSLILPSGYTFKGRGMLSGAYFKADEGLNLIMDPTNEIRSTQTGFAGAMIVGGSVKKDFISKKNTFHSVEAGADFVSEVYTYNTNYGGDDLKNANGLAYTIVKLDTKHKIKNTEFGGGIQTNVSVDKDMTYNDNTTRFYTDNTKSYVYVKQDIGSGKITSSFNQIASVEKKFYTGLVGYENDNKFNVQTGVTVLKYNVDNKAYYQVVRVGKEFDTRRVNLNINGNAMIPVKNSTGYSSPYVGATVIVKPKW